MENARLSQQPRVLHRDHRLRGEILQQRDLLVGERENFFAMHDDRPEQRLVFARATITPDRIPLASINFR